VTDHTLIKLALLLPIGIVGRCWDDFCCPVMATTEVSS